MVFARADNARPEHKGGATGGIRVESFGAGGAEEERARAADSDAADERAAADAHTGAGRHAARRAVRHAARRAIRHAAAGRLPDAPEDAGHVLTDH